jgi:hypothetical protein
MGILIFKGLTARRLYKSFGVKGLRHCATSRKAPGSIPSGITGVFFRGIRQFHVPGVDSAP